MDQNAYRNLVAGTDSRLCTKSLRFVLMVISWCYGVVVVIRNFCYDKKIFKIKRPNAPVISIGNITTGGTGKTPLVIWLCNYLNDKSIDCAILTRGYKSEQGKLTDEPAILAKSCSNANVIVDPDRYAGSQKALQKPNVKALVMDDGFQHRRLHRNLDIVAVDATCPFGYGKLLPAGLLRENIRGLKRAHAVVITRCEQANPENTYDLIEHIKKINPSLVIAKAQNEYPGAIMMKGAKTLNRRFERGQNFRFLRNRQP